jgi:hypothetical protein
MKKEFRGIWSLSKYHFPRPQCKGEKAKGGEEQPEGRGDPRGSNEFELMPCRILSGNADPEAGIAPSESDPGSSASSDPSTGSGDATPSGSSDPSGTETGFASTDTGLSPTESGAGDPAESGAGDATAGLADPDSTEVESGSTDASADTTDAATPAEDGTLSDDEQTLQQQEDQEAQDVQSGNYAAAQNDSEQAYQTSETVAGEGGPDSTDSTWEANLNDCWANSDQQTADQDEVTAESYAASGNTDDAELYGSAANEEGTVDNSAEAGEYGDTVGPDVDTPTAEDTAPAVDDTPPEETAAVDDTPADDSSAS